MVGYAEFVSGNATDRNAEHILRFQPPTHSSSFAAERVIEMRPLAAFLLVVSIISAMVFTVMFVQYDPNVNNGKREDTARLFEAPEVHLEQEEAEERFERGADFFAPPFDPKTLQYFLSVSSSRSSPFSFIPLRLQDALRCQVRGAQPLFAFESLFDDPKRLSDFLLDTRSPALCLGMNGVLRKYGMYYYGEHPVFPLFYFFFVVAVYSPHSDQKYLESLETFYTFPRRLYFLLCSPFVDGAKVAGDVEDRLSGCKCAAFMSDNGEKVYPTTNSVTSWICCCSPRAIYSGVAVKRNEAEFPKVSDYWNGGA